MGYTTKFDGEFKISPPLPAEKIIEWMEFIDDVRILPATGEKGYCQWEINLKGDTVKWDGVEKFYDYKEWLEYCIENFILPSESLMNGRMEYQGEDCDDYGFLVVIDNRLKNKKGSPLFECPNCHEKIQWDYIRDKAKVSGEWNNEEGGVKNG